MASDLIAASATALWTAGATDLTTLAVVPARPGALLVLTTTYNSSSVMSAVSGGGCNASGSGLDGAWQRIAGPLTNASSAKIETWMGKVITPGSSNITVTRDTTPGTAVRLSAKEFYTLGGLGTVWSLVVAGTANGTSTTDTFPSLTPSGINRLYIGNGTNGGSATTTGLTSGYSLELDPGSNPYLYNPSVPNSAQAPTCGNSTNTAWYLCGSLIKADSPVRQPVLPRARIIRASHW